MIILLLSSIQSFFKKIDHLNFVMFQIRKGDILIQNSAVIGFLKNVDEETYTAFSTDVQLFS